MEEILASVGLGALSAASLPLGAWTARWWQPTNRVLGLLTAFGGGALLAAVTIGIVAPVAEEGGLLPLVVGAILGGLLFEGLNQLLNERGGFRRKASTTLVYARERERRRARRLINHLERIDLFDGLPDRERERLIRALVHTTWEPGHVIYREGDPAEHLNIIDRGQVELRHGDQAADLTQHQVFGFRSFLAGAPHRSSATALSHLELYRLEREAFVEVLAEAPTLRQRLRDYLTGPEVVGYLRDEHGLEEGGLEQWRTRAEEDDGHGRVQAVEPSRPVAQFSSRADAIERLPIFRALPEGERAQVARRMVRKTHARGHVFYRRGEPSSRLYVIEDGSVQLLDDTGGTGSLLLGADDAFGGLSCVTGAPHATTAVAGEDVTVWVLRRTDLSALLEELPGLRDAVRRYLAGEQTVTYLAEGQDLTPDRAASWVRSAAKSVNAEGELPGMWRAASHAAAPLAIWLGLMLDGVPESVVIGARTTGTVGVALIAGLMLSNFPEALSSSVGMAEQGLTWGRISMMWLSLVVAAAVGAGVGAVMFDDAPRALSLGLEGLAAGAMLTVVAETMLPEAYSRSGSLIGLAALGGFLATVLVGA